MSLTERLASSGPQLPAAGLKPLIEAAPDPFAELKSAIHAEVIVQLGPQLFSTGMGEGELERVVLETVSGALTRSGEPLSRADRERLTREIADDIVGYGPIEPFLDDDSISEIMVNSPSQIYVERAGVIHETDARFRDDAHLRRIIDKIVATVGRRVDEVSPMCDARLPDGSRVNAVIPPLALNGPSLTIRKFAKRRLTADDLVSIGALSPESVDFLSRCIKARLNVLVAGGTGSGKTTLLNVLSSFIPEGDRIVTIEDAAELQLHQRHVVRLESRPPNIEGKGQIAIRDLVRNSLRMRPDRIVIGEVRGSEALDMLQAMNTGHDGSLSTIHCNSPRDAVSRLETMVLMAGLNLPSRAIREQICSALDMIVQLERLDDGSRRITRVTEVLSMEGDAVTLQDLFVFKYADRKPGSREVVGKLTPTGLRPACTDSLQRHGIDLPAGLFAGAHDINGVFGNGNGNGNGNRIGWR
jgi:pilus assembly protein CpaF